MKTAQLRQEARELYDARNYAEAGKLYRECIKNYPSHHVDSRLATADLDFFEAMAIRCEQYASEVEA
jgi:hypothetical protein